MTIIKTMMKRTIPEIIAAKQYGRDLAKEHIFEQVGQLQLEQQFKLHLQLEKKSFILEKILLLFDVYVSFLKLNFSFFF